MPICFQQVDLIRSSQTGHPCPSFEIHIFSPLQVVSQITFLPVKRDRYKAVPFAYIQPKNYYKTRQTNLLLVCLITGARGGSRTRTPLRALAPEASESTNSTTRAFGWHSFSARLILPQLSSAVNTFRKNFFLLSPFEDGTGDLALCVVQWTGALT